ncbi:MAG: hypothetical protein EZS28_030649 [Streblomastix strix]|uniref:Uncharacterized protein n=1 Tax=Streblomastix strix TaxID=222440 RepID=A0A5J4UU21_9EUKA|nr:MAG: hypothetical protein EZS28_030649 [Streblomastix strix]
MLYKVSHSGERLLQTEIESEKYRSIYIQNCAEFIQSEQEQREELEYLKLQEIANDPLHKPLFASSILIRGQCETLKVFSGESIPVVVRVFYKEYQLPKEIQSKLLERMYRLEDEM